MAKGFWKGAFHGGMIGVAGLVVLSLIAPQSRQEPPARNETTPEAALPAAEAPPPERQPDQPLADAVDLPVGSEFGRGGDVTPNLPSPVAETARQSEPMAVRAPVAEPAPVRAPVDNARPQTAADPITPVQQGPAASEDAPSLAVPAAPQVMRTDTAAIRPEPGAAPDGLPDRPQAGDTQPPALPQPALDLSLPPDLSDLPGMEQR
ncbi:hypothetical protein Q4511_02055 [Paracoccus sp. 1_MG-2023]|uniref:hypothetical protein n=1 Tax=unclassified Paracoccus (in: a-proteobacteria) TaxID=2688777 RepID=UPI001C0A6098|nr:MULTISPECIES: hypothetical protein [unclassified Paracoccus (in: a-proteobacteria)]MBU2958704.1 hypothetical protein [Paracoccus sp. C2R09]MDO6667697.1 hypothetical protein [Paracoccus sp. 1_MG-2023]